MDPCATCQSEFLCGRLAAALLVAESVPDGDARPEVARVCKRIRARLATMGWRDGEAMCDLAGRTDEICHLTNELIRALERGRSLLAEEHTHD